MYDEILSTSPQSTCWFKREVAYFHLAHADDPILTYNLNKAIHPRVKEGFATSTEDHVAFMSEYPDYQSLAEMHRPLFLTGVDESPEMPSKGKDALLLTSRIASWIQVDSPGFMPHKRHYRMFGLAVLHAAQTLRRHVAILIAGGKGLEIPNVSSSHSDELIEGQSSSSHIFGWRDFFDIIIRWRQLSAPGDPVWWTDQLTQKQYSERQGMVTYMHNGPAANVRS